MTITREQLQFSLTVARTIHGLYMGDVLPNVVSRETDTQVLVEKLADGRFAVHFPGTASLQDAVTDLMIPKVLWTPGYIHMGVRRAWLSVAAGVRQIIPAGAEVVITGHSLGGGLAGAAAFDLQSHCNVTQVITFGALRTFNQTAALEYDARFGSKTLRFTNHGDLVPHGPLPLPIWRTGMYWQTATEIHFNEAGQMEINRPWYSSLPPVIRAIAAKLTPTQVNRFISITPHRLTSYIHRLENATTT